MMAEHNVGEEFYLDLHKNELRGWESEKGFIVVAAMSEGAKLGHQFPAVNVVRKNDYYELAFGIDCNNPALERNREKFLDDYGGHHRALAHRMAGVPLRCNLIQDHISVHSGKFRSIGEIVLSDRVHESKLKDALSYLPRDIAEGLCKRSGLDVNKILSQ